MVVAMLLVVALFGGLMAGLVCRGISDRQVLDRLAAQMNAERRMADATHLTMQAMRQTVRRSAR